MLLTLLRLFKIVKVVNVFIVDKFVAVYVAIVVN
jgi:hypothetical protein